MKHHRDSRSNYGPPPGRQSVQPSWISRGEVRVEGTASLPTINGTDWQHYVDRSLLKGGTNFAHPNAVQRSILSALNQVSTSVLAFAPEKSGKTTAFLLGAVQCITKWRQENAPCTVPGAPLVIVVLPSDALVQETAALLQATASTVPPTVSTGEKMETVIRNLSVVTDILLATPGKLGVLLGNMHINTARLVHFIADACEQYSSAADLAPLKHAIAKLRNANPRFTISGGGSRVQTDFRSFIATTLSATHVIVTDETASCSVQPSEPAVLKFTVPPNVAGCVLGKQGSLLQKLKAETQCEITIARPAPNGTQEVTIKGAPEAVQHARARMNKQWIQAGAMVRKKFAFREEFYGLACGSNGTELARFKEEYNVYVSLGNRDNSEYSDFAWIEFSGFPVDVDQACKRFNQLMAGASTTTVAWPEQVEQMLVPLSAKPVILGEKAVTLRGIMKEFGVFLTFKNGQSANGFIPLAIRGLGPGIVRCKQALAEIIRDPVQAEKFREQHKSTQAWPTTENQAARMGVVAADKYIPQAYTQGKKFIVHAPSDFEHFYRQCVRRVLVLNAKSKGEVLASQSFRHSLNRPMRLQLKQRAQDAIKSNQRLEDVVLEVTETLRTGEVAEEADASPFPTAVRPPAAERRSFADAAAADRPSTSPAAPSASRQAQSASLNHPPAKRMRSEGSFGSDLEEGEIP